VFIRRSCIHQQEKLDAKGIREFNELKAQYRHLVAEVSAVVRAE
jgi:hypothetical protein